MKKGFTLIELLVYISLLGIIILIAGRVFKDSTSFRVRTQSMLKATEEATQVGALIQEDIASMGAKSWKTGVATIDSFQIESGVYIDPNNSALIKRDSSSYKLTRSGTGHDSILFRKVDYKPNGTFLGVREIVWSVDADGNLWRSCRTVSGTANDACTSTDPAVPVLMTENVEIFSLTPGTPGAVADTLFPSAAGAGFRLVPRVGDANFTGMGISPINGDNSVSLSLFANNYNNATKEPNLSGKLANEVYVAAKSGNTGTWSTLCKEFTFLPNQPYLISMNLPYLQNKIQMFRPGMDHMAIGLRKKNGSAVAGVSDFSFYPSQSDSAKTARTIELKLSDTTKACLAFTFAFYSPVAYSGALVITDLTVINQSNRTYKFQESYSENVTDVTRKKDVKAFKLELKVKKRGESGEVEITIPVPNNGEKAKPTPAS